MLDSGILLITRAFISLQVYWTCKQNNCLHVCVNWYYIFRQTRCIWLEPRTFE